MSERIALRDPRTGAQDGWITPPSSDEIDATAARLRQAQRRWDDHGLDARRAQMLAWRDRITARRDMIIDSLISDTGRRIESVLEVDAIIGSITRWCDAAPALLAEPDPRPAAIPVISVRQSMHPYSLVGVISPWNFPLLLGLIDAIPALVAGCAVLAKPSEVTPRFVAPLAETVGDVPIAFVTGAREIGEALIDACDAICFTGSVPTGRAVAARAAARMIPAFLELGGKDAAVVLADADLDRASSAILWGGTANAGQSCLSIERIYVDAAVVAPFTEMLIGKAAAVRLAAPDLDDGEIGPIIAEKQIAIIDAHLADASARGAHAPTGGALEEINGGTYLRPTVLTDVHHEMLVMREETFAPILPVMPFTGDDEAVALANDSQYGLSGAVFGAPEHALRVARRIKAGAISINDAALTALVHDAEKNAFNLSGLGGSRMGPAALRRFGRRQAFLVAERSEPDPWWFPSLR